MVKLPEIQPRGVLTRDPQSSVSAQEIANPFQQIAEASNSWADVLERKGVADAQNEGSNAVYRDASGNLQVDTRSNISAVGRSYNAAAETAYTARLAGDIRARGQGLANDAQGNVDTFNSSWKGFADQTMTAVPKQYRGAVKTMLDTEGPRYGLGVSEQKRTSDLKEFEGNIKSEIQFLDDDMSTLARSDGTNTDAYKQKQAQVKTLYQNLADNPNFSVGQKEADIALQRMESRHMSEAMLGTVDKTLQTGGVGAARGIANSIMTDASLSLSPSERRQYSSLANERINGFVAQAKADIKPAQDQAKKIQERLKTGVGLDNDDVDTTAQQLARGGDMAGALELYSSRASARTLSSFRAADNGTQVNSAERLFSSANGGDNVISAIKQVESGGDPNQVSSAGAAGTMQVMPGTGDEVAREIGDKNYPATGTDAEKRAYLKNPDVSEAYGTHYFNKMMARYNGDQQAALVAYNGGPDRADKWLAAGRDDSVLPKETADYYKKVQAAASSVPSTYSTDEITAARGFLQTRTDKGAEAITGLQDGFAVKVSRMFQAAPPNIREGLGIFSGFRTDAHQAQLWDQALQKYGSVAEARKWVSPPAGVEGSKGSEHGRGDAADVSYNGQSLAKAPADVVAWVHQNAAAYGLKFPLGNENWHIEDAGTRGGAGAQPQVDPDVVKAYREEMTADSKQLFSDIKSGADRGLTPSVTDLDLLHRQLAITDDQDFKKQVADYFTDQQAIQGVSSANAAQTEALISSLKADSADGATIAQQQIITGMQDAAKAKADALNKDPLGYAIDKRLIQPPPPLDLNQPDTWGSTFQGLQRGVDTLRAHGDVGNISALRPDMLDQVTRALQSATPQDSVRLLGSMAQNLSSETYKATLAKIYSSGQGNAVAAAGALVPDNPQVAEGILRGQALLKENPLLAPKKNDDNISAINDILPIGAFAPSLEGARQGLLDAATARYADLSQQSGDTSGDLNSDRMDQAVKEVTGGLLDMNGSQVIAPKYGMTQDDFDTSMSKLSNQDLMGAVSSNGTQVTARDLRSQGRLRAVADGRYVLEFGSTDHPTYAVRSAPTPTGGADLNSVFVLDMRNR
jgi:soluble lytic murein transglycosylase-like protein